MRKIIDSNQITSEALERFLSASPANQAVLTDYAAMEAYQSAGEGVFRSFGVLGKYPKQVLILKNTQTVCGLSGRGRGLQKRLIDSIQSREFPIYTANLRKAERGELVGLAYAVMYSDGEQYFETSVAGQAGENKVFAAGMLATLSFRLMREVN